MKTRLLALLLVFVACTFGASAATAGTPAYFRYPDLHGDRIVFSAEADLWIASDEGGVARRLTTHPGNEVFASFSPDGAWIAFTGQYDGNSDVYLISSGGGDPRRLTWHPASDEVIGWTPDGKSVIFRSSRSMGPPGTELFQVPVSGGDSEKLPLGWAARVDIDPKTGMWAFNRSARETATWKRYRGGTAADIWVGDPRQGEYKQITTFQGADAFPMWHEGRIYFLSDRGGTDNIWSILPDGSDPRQHTDFKDWDARWPGMGPDGRIAFVLGGDLQVFDPRANAVRKVDVDLPSDHVLTRSRYPDASKNLTYFSLSPEGDRLAVVTRGEIFSVPAKKGVTLPVTHGSGARESFASFDGEGKRILYLTDAPGEQEIRIMDAWGRGEPTVVKPAADKGWIFPPHLSPDGKWVAYADETQTLYVMPASGGAPKVVDRSTQAEIREYVWSPDSRWLAYSKALSTDYLSIYVYDVKDAQVHEITGPMTDDFSPEWDPEGRYLYFLSRRHINPFVGTQDWDNVEVKNIRPYLVLLRKDVKNPFLNLDGLPPEEDAKKDDAKKGGKEEEKGKEEKKGPEPIAIDFDGIQDRVLVFDVPIGNYYGLGATAKNVFYLDVPVRGAAEGSEDGDGGPGPDATLMTFDLEKRETKPFMEGVSTYALALEGGKIAVMKQPGEISVVDSASPPGDLGEARVDMSDVVIELDPREEWKQIYWEAWREQREFFWDQGMGGLDWKAMGEHYATLLPRLSTRGDLQDLLGQLIGELNNSHTYTWGGDPGVQVPRVSIGLLGGEVVREGAAYRIARIYRGDPADNVTAPLATPGANLREGDTILAVNHQAFDPGRSFFSYFDNLAGKEVVLTVNGRNAAEGSRDVVVETIGSDADLRYADWVRRNREVVAEKTGGKIGYIHIPDMGPNGLIRFNTWFYPQLGKEGMVVDGRWNGGGSVSQMMVARLARTLVSFDRSRAGGLYTYPGRVLNGPFVVLTNEFAGSDGDIFPAAIKKLKLAPVIGMRSWGGVVGIRGDKTLVDGGMVTQPEYAWWEPEGGWTIENYGVDPDIVVQNMPQDLARGYDAQLDRAITEVLRLRQEKPPIVPKFGPVPPRGREAYRKELEGMK